MDKKTVHFIPNPHDSVHIGVSAYVNDVLDHPGAYVSNRKPVHTSRVINITDKKDGLVTGFETMNTKYVAVKEGEVERQPKDIG